MLGSMVWLGDILFSIHPPPTDLQTTSGNKLTRRTGLILEQCFETPPFRSTAALCFVRSSYVKPPATMRLIWPFGYDIPYHCYLWSSKIQGPSKAVVNLQTVNSNPEGRMALKDILTAPCSCDKGRTRQTTYGRPSSQALSWNTRAFFLGHSNLYWTVYFILFSQIQILFGGHYGDGGWLSYDLIWSEIFCKYRAL